MIKKDLKIVSVTISSLKPAAYNPRKLTLEQERNLTESIKEFGLIDPVIVNNYKKRKNIIVGGHQRLKIAKKLKFTKVPVIYVSLTPTKEKELNLRLNKNTGEWDYELLKEFDSSLLLDIGFDDNDLSNIWDGSLETEEDDFNCEKELEKAKQTKIKIGDFYALGKHRLICGDATDKDVIKKLLDNNKIDMIYSDPPYNIGLNYAKGIGGKKNYGGKVDDNKSKLKYKELLVKTITNALVVGKDNIHIFYYCDQQYIGLLQKIYSELRIDYKRTCLWVKNGFNPTPNVAFNKCYEPCVYGTIGKPYLSNIKNLSEILNKEVETGNRAMDDIFDMIDIWLAKRLPGQEYEHPTEKSPTLHEKALRRCTKVNDIVLDMFGGSGSTLIACEQLKRRCFISEINPIFCQLIINRFEKYANTKTKKIN